MSVHIKRVPQVLSGDNFPATDPEDGTYFVFNVAQTSFITGKTVRNDADDADVTEASESDLFKYFENGTKWVRQYKASGTPRTDEDIRDVVAGYIRPSSNLDVIDDDANDTLTLEAIRRRLIGPWNIETDTVDADGELKLISETSIRIHRNDSDGNDKSGEFSGTNLGTNARLLIVKADDTTKRLHLTLTGNGSTNNTYFTLPVTMRSDSSPLSDFADGDSVNVYRVTVMSDEAIRDLIADFIKASTNVTVTHDDAANTLTIAATDTNTQRTDEEIRDVIASFLAGSTNVTVTHDDAGDTLTITATDTNTQRTDEDIRDVVAAQATAGDNITITEDDANDTLTYAAFAPTLLGRWQRNDTVIDLTGTFHRATYGSGDEGINISHTDADGNDKETRLDVLSANDEIWLVPASDQETIVRLNIASVESPIWSDSNRYFYTLGTDSDAFTDIADEEEVFIYHIDSSNTTLLNTQRTNEEIRDVVAAEAIAEIIYGTATTSYTTTDTDTNLIAGRNFSDYRYLLFVFVSTYGNKFYWTEFIAEAVFPNGQSILGLSTSGRAVRLERKNNTTFQLKYVNGSAAFRYIIGIF